MTLTLHPTYLVRSMDITFHLDRVEDVNDHLDLIHALETSETPWMDPLRT